MKFAISACLVGDNTKYNGGNNYNKELVEFLKDKEYITICPEVLGGLSTPRSPSEKKDGKVINKEGKDVTANFINGAIKAKELLKDVDVVIVKANSPSCGKGKIYDGTFNNKLVDGNGVFVDMIIKENIKIFTEKQLDEIKKLCED